MYNIVVESPIFEGKNIIQQQRLVNEVISEEIKSIHGYSLKTRAPKKAEPNSDKKVPDASNPDQNQNNNSAEKKIE